MGTGGWPGPGSECLGSSMGVGGWTKLPPEWVVVVGRLQTQMAVPCQERVVRSWWNACRPTSCGCAHVQSPGLKLNGTKRVYSKSQARGEGGNQVDPSRPGTWWQTGLRAG